MASSIPGALTAFISLAETALGDTVLVWYGTPLKKYETPILLEIAGVTGDQSPAALGPDYKREEHYTIHCTLSSYYGNDDFVTRTTDVLSAFDSVFVAVGNNPTLNSNVRIAQVTDFTLTPEADPKGAAMSKLVFGIYCEARIASLS